MLTDRQLADHTSAQVAVLVSAEQPSVQAVELPEERQSMQTVQHHSDELAEARWLDAKRHQLNYRMNGPAATFAMGAVIFAIYILLAIQMDGFTFDTTFLATYCTALSVFIIKAFLPKQES